jgi:hypothetical protein
MPRFVRPWNKREGITVDARGRAVPRSATPWFAVLWLVTVRIMARALRDEIPESGRKSIDFDQSHGCRPFLAEDDGEPIVRLNLLRFQPDGGRDHYSEYLGMAGPVVARYGAQIVFAGDGLTGPGSRTRAGTGRSCLGPLPVAANLRKHAG